MVLKTLRQKIDVLVGEDRGVSPVIGVILMVAITVILAAVIGAFVMGLGDDIGTNVQAGANADFDSSAEELRVSYSTTQNADYLTVSVNGQAVTDDSGPTPSGTGDTYELRNVGESIKLSGTEMDNVGNQGDSFTVIVTAHTDDGSSTVVLETSETLSWSSLTA